MRQDLIEANKDFMLELIGEMAVAFKEDPKKYIATKNAIKKADPVGQQDKDKRHRYGVFLTQEGENFVYRQLLRLERLYKEKYSKETFNVVKETKEVMCTYIMKEAFRIAKLPFESNFSIQVRENKRYFTYKMAGFIVFSIFFLVVIIIAITTLF